MKNGKYILVVAPPAWPGVRYRGRYCYEHQLVYWEHTGHLVAADEIVHHINGDTTDNRFKNLELMTRGAHSAHHVEPAEMLELECYFCGEAFSVLAHVAGWKLKNGQERFFCCRSHQVKQQWVDRRSGVA